MTESPPSAERPGIATEEVGPGGDRENPFPGPRPFGENEGELFFGRERELSDLVALLFAHRALLLHAASGAGKSSLVRAGLLPRARERGFEILPVARVKDLSPQVEGTLDGIGNRYVRNLVQNWRGTDIRTPSGARSLSEVLADLPPATEPGRVLVFDQFEELFLLHPEAWKDRPDFLMQVQRALDRDPLLRVLFVLRDDYLARLQPLTPLLRDRLSTRYHLQKLSPAQAMEAVVKPFEAAGRPFAPGVAEALVKALRAQPPVDPGGDGYESEDVEPVQLQIVCRTFFERLPDDVAEITSEDVAREADVGQALTGFYEGAVAAAVARHPAVSQSEVRLWFERELITPADTRGIVFRDKRTTAGLPNEVVDELEERRLLRSEPRGPDTWYELAHDSLVKPVRESNRSWREQYLSPLQVQAELWEEQQRSESLLLRGEALEQAIVWAEAHGGDLTSSHRQFLHASREAAEREQRDRRNQFLLRTFAIVAAVLLVLSVIVTIQARSNATAARRAAAASKAQELLFAADAERATDPTLSLLLTRTALEKLGSSSGPQAVAAQSALYEAVYHGPERLENTLPDVAAHDAAFSPDGRFVATAGNDGRARIWDVRDVRPRTVTENRHDGPVNAVAFTRDGRNIVTASRDGTARVWDVRDGRELARFPPPDPKREGLPELTSVALSPDGTRLATGNATGSVAVWDLGSKTHVLPTLTHPPAVHALQFSPDGATLVTAGEDGKAIVWDLATAGVVRAVEAGAPKRADEGVKKVTAVAFSPDGGRLATASASGRASVWDLVSGRELLVLAGAPVVNDITFSPDGELLATSAATRGDPTTATTTATVWSARTGRKGFSVSSGPGAEGSTAFAPDGSLLVTTGSRAAPAMWDASGGEIKGHTASVYAAAFHPEGRRVATASADGTATVWEIEDEPEESLVLSGHAGEVNDVAFSPDGTRLATAGDDKVAKLWDATSGAEILTLSGHDDYVRAVAFTPDGTHLVTASADQSVKVWDLASGQQTTTIAPLQGALWDAALSPDGSQLATVGSDGSAKVWDLRSGLEQRKVAAHKETVRGVAFSPDGRQLATAGTDRFARVWDLASGAVVHQLSGEDEAVFDVAFSPDGGRVAAVGAKGIARVWTLDPAAPSTPLELSGHPDHISGVAFSVDGSRVVTTSRDQTAQVWEAQSGRRIAVLAGTRRGHTAAVNDARFSPDGSRLATASADGTVKVWETRTRWKPGGDDDAVTFSGHAGGVNAVAFSPDGKLLAATGNDGTTRLWEIESRAELHVLEGHAGPVTVFGFSPDGTRMVTAGDDGTTRLWEVESRAELHVLEGHAGQVTAADFSPDGKRVVTAGEDGTARLWDAGSGRELPFATGVPRLQRTLQPFSGVAFSPDGKTIATSTDLGDATLWNVESGKEKTDLPNHDRMPFTDIAFSRDGKRIAAAGERGTVVWEVESPTSPTRIRHGAKVEGVAFGADGNDLLAAGPGSEFHVYPLQRQRLLELARALGTRPFSPTECERFLNDSC